MIGDYVKLDLGVLTDRPPPIAVISDGESMERFRTIAFDTGIMRQGIRWEPLIPGLDCGLWIDAIVPECYRSQVRAVVLDVHNREFVGQKYRGSETIDRFIYLVRVEVWARIEPVMP
jgi:hypothetical protein